MILSCVSVPVLSVQSTSIAPKLWMALRRFTTTFRLAMAIAPFARLALTSIGSISGVRPTATETANRNACSVRGLVHGRTRRVVLLDRQGLAGQRGLADEDVTGGNQPNVSRNEVAGRQSHDVAGNELGDGYFAGLRFRIGFGTPQHRGGGAHQGFELFRRQNRAVLLPKLQSDAAHHHPPDPSSRPQGVP